MIRRAKNLKDEFLIYLLDSNMIRGIAKRFVSDCHYKLNLEDLVGEGFLVFSELIEKALKKDPNLKFSSFKGIFITSLVNHYKTLMTRHLYTKKHGYEGEDKANVREDKYIDLSDIAEIVGCTTISEIFFEKYVVECRSLLSGNNDALRLFDCLVNPPEDLVEVVVSENKRKLCLVKQGRRTKDYKEVRIRVEHICRYMRISEDEFYSLKIIVEHIVKDIVLNYKLFRQAKQESYS